MNTGNGFRIAAGLQIERLGATYLVLVESSQQVYELTGARAEAFALACRGADVVPDRLAGPMAGLVELGLVHSRDWTRRRVLQLGGAAVAATIATVALPSVAAADSGPGDGTGPDPDPEPDAVDVGYLVVGGGAGGGWFGGGGAGQVIEDLPGAGLEPGRYTVTIGAGGGMDENGGDTKIDGPTEVTAIGGGTSGTDGGSGGGGESDKSGGKGLAGHDGGHGGKANPDNPSGQPGAGGGGGGAGQPGADGPDWFLNRSADGGDGVPSSLATAWSGVEVGGSPAIGEEHDGEHWVGGGGGGESLGINGSPGLGGGGLAIPLQQSGKPNTGGGSSGTRGVTATGGSGVVIIRYALADASRFTDIDADADASDDDYGYLLFTGDGSFEVT